MTNNEAGAFLNITPDVLKKLDSFDEKLEKIEKHAHTAADALKNGFGKVVVDTSKLENAITSLASKMNALNNAGKVVGDIGTSMNQVSKDATKAASSLSSVAQSINKVKPDNSLAKSVEQYRNISSQIEQVSGRQKQLNDIIKSYELTMSRIQSGKGGVIQAGQQQQVQSAKQELEANNQLIATLKQKQQEIINTNAAYQKQIQLVERLKTYNQELNSLPNQRSNKTLADMRAYYSELEKSSARAAKEAEQAAARESKADEKRYNEWLRRKAQEEKEATRVANAKAKADEQAMKASLAAYRNTPQGALGYSKNTKSLQQNVQAIEYLKKARLSLNTTDANYKNTLEQINQAIARHNQALTEAGVKSQQLATRHRNLMDTAGQLSRQLALVFSVSQIEGYISKLAKVRGEFELQQRSLQAILQNKSQADQIFNKTVQLAVKSPFQIKELVTFTKQLAAYRIESDKLYDTTKRLADVSAGLGVDMGRLILAYGQVKAAAYLRGTEVRQFTEAGINLYGELQRYFEEVKGEAYTTAQIVDMISKRKVTFEDIENIFKRLTDSGGLFYNMQEIQAETLQGKISNLKDSIDVMLNSIGKANEDTLKGSIDAVKVLIDNWETVVNIAKAFAPIIASMAITAWTKKIGVANGAIGLFSVGLGKAGNAIKAFGATFKASFPLMAITAALGVFNELIKIQDEYNKRQKEAENRYYKGKVRSSEIERISVTIDEKTSKPQIKEALNALVKEMNNEGFEIEIKANISEDEAKEQYDKLLKQHKQYLDDMLVLDYKYNADKKSNSMFWETDADEANERLTESYQKALATITQIRAELAKVADKGIGFIAQEELKELEQGVTESGSLEAIQDYYTRLLDFLESIEDTRINFSPTSAGGQSTITTTFAGIKSNILENVNVIKNSLDSSKNGMTEKIRSFFDNVFNFKNYDNDVKAAMVNNYAISHGWSQDFVQQITAPIYNIDFTKKRETNNNTGQDADTKLQRDILAERISLIKELNKEYEKLNKVMGSDKAAKTVMERYEKSLKNVNMPKSIIGDMFIPNKQNTAKALQEISKIITDFRKKQGAINDSYQLLDSDDIENIQKQLEKTKKNIEDMFNQLDLHQKLKDAGLSEAEVQQLFPGLAKTLDDVEKEMKASYEKNFPKGEYLIADTDANKQYLADLDKLNQQRIKEKQDTIERLVKSYKTQLSEQLQLDEQYYKDLEEIRDKFQNTPDLQKRLEENATKMYNQKSANNAWKEFTSSDSYLNLFDNIEYYSTAALQSMKDKLVKMREELKDLSPTELKQIMEQEEKLDKQLNQRDPWNKLTKSLKEYTKLRKENAKNEKDEAKARDLQAKYEEQLRTQRKIVAEKKAANESATENIDAALEEYEVEQNNYDLLVDKKKKQDEIVAGYDAANRALSQQAQKLQGIIQSLGKIDMGGGMVESISGITNSVSDFAHMLEDSFGVAIGEDLYEILDGVGALFGSLESFDITKPISSSLNVLTGLGKTIGSIFGIGNKDKKKEREIQRQIKNIETLGKAYDELKEKMEAAWSADDLRTQTKDTVANLDSQIASHQAMIKAEEDKKKTDHARIEEWQDAIEELKKTKQEILNQEKIEMGGIGGESEYKDAASSFVQAWLDAFNETGDGLKGLEENFDDFINNLFLKQASMRIANKFLEPLFQMIDLAVTEGEEAIRKGFDGDTKVTRQEMDKIVEDAKKQFPQLSEALEDLYNALGIKDNKKAELSALQQGIQSMSEETAGELQALLNSIRFFVSQQTTDISAIRTLLDARYGLETEYSDSNPMLVELRTQTGYLEILSDRIDRVFAPSPNSKGAGIRVFMQ